MSWWPLSSRSDRRRPFPKRGPTGVPMMMDKPSNEIGSNPAPSRLARSLAMLLPFLAGGVQGGQDLQADLADEIVFAVRKPGQDGHWYANFSYYAADCERMAYADGGGKLCRLDPRTGKLTILLEDAKGSVRDPQVHYDGKKILFSYRKGGSTHFHLHEINADGSGLKQLTDGDCDDIEPTYLPDGGIMFCSSRCNRWVNCWLTQVAVLYRCDGDGTNIRMVSSNNEHDNTPWVLPDGRVLYQRWEYVDRSQVHYHHLWTTNPDGTGQMVFYGNQHPGVVMIDAKPIPGGNKVLAIFSPGHGRKEHDGAIAIVDPGMGPDHLPSARIVNKENNFRDPYALAPDRFLAARGPELVVMDEQGATQCVYRLPEAERKAGLQCHEPRPLRPRKREHVIPPRAQPKQATGRLVLADIYEGRNMENIERGEIADLLVLETLPKPINYTGGMEPLSYGGTFTLQRILGTVPVEADGSAYLELPALRSVFFVARDKAGLSVKRMQSFTTVQPGEVTSCVGCHEQRTRTPLPVPDLLALRRPASRIEPVADVPDVFDFPRDIQPILDTHCVACHDYEETAQGGPREGGVILTGDHGPLYSHSYYNLTVRGQFVDGRNRPRSNYPPRAIGSSASPLLHKGDGSHYGATFAEHERKMVALWIDTGATYPGTYAALGTGMIGGYEENRNTHADFAWPAVREARGVLARRCAQCHSGPKALPETPSVDRFPPWALESDDLKLRLSRHIVYNLTRAEKSSLLLAPLAQEAGGMALCKETTGETKGRTATVFANTDDPDYRKLLAAVQTAKEYLDTIKRFDMPGFRPRDAYVREMKRYGIIPGNQDPGTPIDPYATDRAYWESLWYRPEQP